MLFRSMLYKVVTYPVKTVSHKPPEEANPVLGCLHANVLFDILLDSLMCILLQGVSLYWLH